MKAWVNGLITAVVSGAATAAGAMMLDPEHFGTDHLKHLAMVAGLGALGSVINYLRRSPLPAVLPLLLILLLPVSASAQTPWGSPIGFDDTWTQYPQTTATLLVRQALTNGYCADTAVRFINDQRSVPAILWPAGPGWPYNTIVWYGKGTTYCEGKFQYGGQDGPYTQGWEVRWNGNQATWRDDTYSDPPGSPASIHHHPTEFTITPYGPVNPNVVTPPPPPVVTPPPIVTPPPVPAPAPLPSVDFQAALDKAVADLKAAIQEDGDKTRAKVDNPGWFTKAVSNPYVQGVLVAIGTCASTQCWRAKQ